MLNRKILYFAIFAALIGVAAFIFFNQSLLTQIRNIQKGDPLYKLTSQKKGPLIKINEIEIEVEIAETPQEKAKGLSDRNNLGEKQGMLFIFENKTKPSFWMKDMLMSIDIIWITDGKIVGIEKSVPAPEKGTPSELPLYPPPEGIDYVLEVNAGFSEENGIMVGNEIDLSEIFNN